LHSVKAVAVGLGLGVEESEGAAAAAGKARAEGGPGDQHTHDAAAIVNWLSTSHRERSLNLALTDGKLGIQELKHYSDVRRVFRRFPAVLVGLALASALLILAARPSLGLVAAAQWRGLILWAGLLLGIGGLA
jgi:hypothetical protein